MPPRLEIKVKGSEFTRAPGLDQEVLALIDTFGMGTDV
jgi:hypothetical protein